MEEKQTIIERRDRERVQQLEKKNGSPQKTPKITLERLVGEVGNKQRFKFTWVKKKMMGDGFCWVAVSYRFLGH